jgi:adenosylhomocysteine nucleosidase
MVRVGIDVVVFCATEAEAMAARSVLREPFGHLLCGRVHATVGHLGGAVCLTVAAGMTRKRLENTLEAVTARFRPRLLVNFGAAGGVAPEIEIGTPTLPREILSYTWPGLAVEGDLIECPAAARLTDLDPGVRTTRAGSCRREIRDDAVRHRLAQTLRLDTTDWETYSLADACRRLQIPFLALRCVTDHADSQARLDHSKNAAAVLARGACLLPQLAARALELFH